MNPIVKSTQQTLSEFNEVMRQLSDAQFSESLPIFSGSSIGMHARHVIEFYQCILKENIENQGINYDNRKRDMLLQTNRGYFNTVAEIVIEQLGLLDSNKLKTPLSIFSDEITEIEPVTQQGSANEQCSVTEHNSAIGSSIGRELQYNLEHTIHHAALIKIGILTLIPDAYMPKSFGVAASTIRYQEQKKVVA